MPEFESRPEMIRILARTGDDKALLSIVADGKQVFYTLDLKQVLTVIESGTESVRKLTTK